MLTRPHPSRSGSTIPTSWREPRNDLKQCQRLRPRDLFACVTHTFSFEHLCKILRRGLNCAVLKSPPDQPERITHNPPDGSKLSRPRFIPTNSRLVEMTDACVQEIEDAYCQQRPTSHTMQFMPPAVLASEAAGMPFVHGVQQNLSKRCPTPGNWQRKEVSLANRAFQSIDGREGRSQHLTSQAFQETIARVVTARNTFADPATPQRDLLR